MENRPALVVVLRNVWVESLLRRRAAQAKHVRRSLLSTLPERVLLAIRLRTLPHVFPKLSVRGIDVSVCNPDSNIMRFHVYCIRSISCIVTMEYIPPNSKFPIP
jgi:hypothetical protein